MEFQRPPQPAKEASPSTPADVPTPSQDLTESSAEVGPAPGPTLAAPGFHVISDEAGDAIALGDDRKKADNPYKFSATVSQTGASISSVKLAEYLNEVARDKKNPKHDPYRLLETIKNPSTGEIHQSFSTKKIRLLDDKHDVSLADVVWFRSKDENTSDDGGEFVSLWTLVKHGDNDVLRLTKTYRLKKDSYHLRASLKIENLSDKPRKIILTEGGPIGIAQEEIRWDYRRVVTALVDEDGLVVDGENEAVADVEKSEGRLKELAYDRETNHLLWSALGNKYFACIMAPQPLTENKGQYPNYLTKVTAKIPIDIGGPLTFEQVFAPQNPIAPGGSLTIPIEIYCGAKSRQLFNNMEEAVERNYFIASHADSSMCTFVALSKFMYWLLTSIYKGVSNYGVAIIILVIIVRFVLHPISKHGQLSMMKMQKNQQRIKPKLEALQKQYKNDKQKLQEEQMKLYREEGLNPAGTLLGCLPMALQMPIWVALWTTLNTNVEMRHEPFFGYIRDLSAPDALVTFAGGGFDIPLLWRLIGPITSFNLLPLLMSGVMYGQQKLTQKLTKPDKPAAPKLDADGNPLPDTMAQQQKMMNVMMIFMGLFFYNFPSGLCLYILSSSLLGMGEQYYIRKHLKEQEARGEFDGKKKADKKPGWLARKFQEAQKMAEEQRQTQSKKPPIGRPRKQRKKARF